MVSVKIEDRVEHPGLPLLGNFAVEFVEEIRRLGQLRLFRERLFALRDAPTVGDQSGNARDQTDRFPDVCVVRIVAQVLVECAQHRNAGAQHVHRMRFARK